MSDLIPLFAAIVTTLGALGVAYFTARRFSKLGIGAAQLQLSETLRNTMQSQATEIASLTRQLGSNTSELTQCKLLLSELEKANRALKDSVADLVLAAKVHG